MRISIIEQSKTFLKTCKSKDTWTFKRSDVKKSIRDYLTSVDMMFSPYNWIFVVKKSSDTKYKNIKNNIYAILSNIGWVISWEFALNYYLGKIKFLKEYEIFIWNTQYIWYLWEEKKIKINFKKAKKQRWKQEVNIEWIKLIIESPLSFIVNNIKNMEENKDFIEFVLKQRFENVDIIQALLSWYKISWLSRLAIFYKNYEKKAQYLVIKNTIEEAWKKLDRRWNKVKVLIKPKIKERNTAINLDDLI